MEMRIEEGVTLTMYNTREVLSQVHFAELSKTQEPVRVGALTLGNRNIFHVGISSCSCAIKLSLTRIEQIHSIQLQKNIHTNLIKTQNSEKKILYLKKQNRLTFKIRVNYEFSETNTISNKRD